MNPNDPNQPQQPGVPTPPQVPQQPMAPQAPAPAPMPGQQPLPQPGMNPQQPMYPQQPRTPGMGGNDGSKKKLIMIVAGAVVLLIVAVLLIVLLGGGSDDAASSNSDDTSESTDSGKDTTASEEDSAETAQPSSGSDPTSIDLKKRETKTVDGVSFDVPAGWVEVQEADGTYVYSYDSTLEDNSIGVLVNLEDTETPGLVKGFKSEYPTNADIVEFLEDTLLDDIAASTGVSNLKTEVVEYSDTRLEIIINADVDDDLTALDGKSGTLRMALIVSDNGKVLTYCVIYEDSFNSSSADIQSLIDSIDL